MSDRPHRSYCFTLNNPKTLPDFLLSDGTTLLDGIRYVIYQEECGETGNYHLQGYLELTRPMRMAALIALVPGFYGAHLEIRRGSRDQARDYCRKHDATTLSDPVEYGSWPTGGSGARSDLVSLYGDLKSGKSYGELLDLYPAQFMRLHRGIDFVRQQLANGRDWKTFTILCVGPPGTGKSRYARALFPYAFWKHPTSKWWDGYHGQDEVVWDDFGKTSCAYSELLRILDRYPLAVETKGSSVSFLAKTLVITSNSLPSLWYHYDEKRMFLGAVTRRLDKILIFKPQDYWPDYPDLVREFTSWDALQAAWPYSLSAEAHGWIQEKKSE